MLPDFYKILGVSINASDDEIKMAFRLRAKRLHPDKNPSKNSLARFQILALAYETLKDAEKRKRYDLKKMFGIELTPESDKAQPKHRDPRYRPGAAKATFAGDFEGSHREPKRERIIWLENLLFFIVLVIGIAALGFAVSDMMNKGWDLTEKEITGMVFSTSFLVILVYGWFFYIRKMK